MPDLIVQQPENVAAPTGGETRVASLTGDSKKLVVNERASISDDATSHTLGQKFPKLSRLISAQVKYITALAVDGTNGTNGTADAVALVKTAPTSLTTNVTTQTIVQGSTTKTANTLTVEMYARNDAEWVNETTNDVDVYLVPWDPNGAETFDVATDGYLFNGTQTVEVELVFEQIREIPDA